MGFFKYCFAAWLLFFQCYVTFSSMSAKSHDANLFGFLEQIDRMEQFFVASGLPHLVFYYQDTELAEGGTMKKKEHSVNQN